MKRLGQLLLLISVFGALPCKADILVTLDGQQIETRGPWEVRGRQVVFTTPEGRLRAIRVSEVDLEASELATNPPAPAPPPPPPPPAPKAAPIPARMPSASDSDIVIDNRALEEDGSWLKRYLHRSLRVEENKMDQKLTYNSEYYLYDAWPSYRATKRDGIKKMVSICASYDSLHRKFYEIQQLVTFISELEACIDDIEKLHVGSYNSLSHLKRALKMAKEEPDDFLEIYGAD